MKIFLHLFKKNTNNKYYIDLSEEALKKAFKASGGMSGNTENYSILLDMIENAQAYNDYQTYLSLNKIREKLNQYRFLSALLQGEEIQGKFLPVFCKYRFSKEI